MTYRFGIGLLATALILGAAGCNSNPPRQPLCNLPDGNDLDAAMARARFDLHTGCASRFDDYFRGLLQIGAQNPDPDNRRLFSDFLEWTVDEGLLGRRQAQERYNRYFNVKYVSLMSDYSVCSETCPSRSRLFGAMQQERLDKELGLLKISADRSRYQRADRLYHETELVLEATCQACDSY
jgi:hypothetical protein